MLKTGMAQLIYWLESRNQIELGQNGWKQWFELKTGVASFDPKAGPDLPYFENRNGSVYILTRITEWSEPPCVRACVCVCVRVCACLCVLCVCVCVHVCVSSLKYGMDFAIFIGYVVYYLWGEGGGQFCSTEQEPPPFPFLRSYWKRPRVSCRWRWSKCCILTRYIITIMAYMYRVCKILFMSLYWNDCIHPIKWKKEKSYCNCYCTLTWKRDICLPRERGIMSWIENLVCQWLAGVYGTFVVRAILAS